jgi:hypothetical protein
LQAQADALMATAHGMLVPTSHVVLTLESV